jgi:hypothetical protein
MPLCAVRRQSFTRVLCACAWGVVVVGTLVVLARLAGPSPHEFSMRRWTQSGSVTVVLLGTSILSILFAIMTGAKPLLAASISYLLFVLFESAVSMN